MCIAEENGQRQSGYQGGGGRRALDVFTGDLDPCAIARESARQAVLQLRAIDAPAGPMEVVLGPGWPGILLHEAIGHGLEADFNRKKTSAFAGLVGQKVGSELCTVVDDITSGKFVFTASEAYLIENGQITAPVKGATLIGDGPTVLRQVTAVGNDLKLDQGVGICGKEGQTIPVSVGLPTIKIREITVGGTEK